jgi:hypothetical protein
MKINSEAQAPAQAVRKPSAPPPEEHKTRALKAPEKPPEPPKAQGHIGRNIDTQA